MIVALSISAVLMSIATQFPDVSLMLRITVAAVTLFTLQFIIMRYVLPRVIDAHIIALRAVEFHVQLMHGWALFYYTGIVAEIWMLMSFIDEGRVTHLPWNGEKASTRDAQLIIGKKIAIEVLKEIRKVDPAE
jgi:hypothetical protein